MKRNKLKLTAHLFRNEILLIKNEHKNWLKFKREITRDAPKATNNSRVHWCLQTHFKTNEKRQILMKPLVKWCFEKIPFLVVKIKNISTTKRAQLAKSKKMVSTSHKSFRQIHLSTNYSVVKLPAKVVTSRIEQVKHHVAHIRGGFSVCSCPNVMPCRWHNWILHFARTQRNEKISFRRSK